MVFSRCYDQSSLTFFPEELKLRFFFHSNTIMPNFIKKHFWDFFYCYLIINYMSLFSWKYIYNRSVQDLQIKMARCHDKYKSFKISYYLRPIVLIPQPSIANMYSIKNEQKVLIFYKIVHYSHINIFQKYQLVSTTIDTVMKQKVVACLNRAFL